MRRCVVLLSLASPLLAQTASVSATVDGVVKSATLALRPRSTVTASLPGGSVVAGQSITLDLSIASTRMLPAALQFDLTAATADVASVVVSEGPAAVAAGKTFACSAISPEITRCLLSGLNANRIGNGIVGRVAVAVKATAGASATIQLSGFVVSSAFGKAMLSVVAPGGGIIAISQPFAFACAATEIEPDEDVICTTTLPVAAPVGGKAVAYASSDILKVTVAPASGLIAAGATTGSTTTTGR